MRICVTNLGAYNEGRLLFRWLALPYTDDELEAILKTIGIGGRYEEVLISDYETDIGLRIGEYDSLRELNEIAERIDGMDTYELMTLKAVVEYEGADVSDMTELIDRLDEYHLYDGVSTDEELGHYWIHEVGGFNLDLMGELAEYLDYEAYGRNMRLNSSGNYTKYGWLECS